MRKSARLVGFSSNRMPSAPMPRCRSHNCAIWLRSKSMSRVLLSNRIKSFPAPFIFVKRSMMVIVAAARQLVMSSVRHPERSEEESKDPAQLRLVSPRDSSTSLGMTGTRCHIEFWRYLFRSEKAGRVDLHGVSQPGSAVLVRRRLQRPGSRAGQRDAERRPIFCFAFCKDSFAIIGTFRVGKILCHPCGAEFLFGRDVFGVYQNDRSFARTWSASSRLRHA